MIQEELNTEELEKEKQEPKPSQSIADLISSQLAGVDNYLEQKRRELGDVSTIEATMEESEQPTI